MSGNYGCALALMAGVMLLVVLAGGALMGGVP